MIYRCNKWAHSRNESINISVFAYINLLLVNRKFSLIQVNSRDLCNNKFGDDVKKKKELVEVNGSLRTVWKQC